MSALETKLHEELDERLRFETMLVEISTHFINLPSDRIDQSIEDFHSEESVNSSASIVLQSGSG